jgi:hypothetical protein
MIRLFPRFGCVYGPIESRPQPLPIDWAAFWDFLQKVSLVLGLVVVVRQLSE